jgi:hypothetical protein
MDREGADIGEGTANMPSTHRTYDKDFRQEAVNLLRWLVDQSRLCG